VKTRLKWHSVWIVLIGGSLSLIGCHGKPLPPATDYSRGCYLGMVPPSQLEQVQTWAPAARVGDMLLSPECDAEETESQLNEIRRNTR